MRLLILLLIVLSLSGCEDEKDFSKDYKTKKIIDSLFRDESILIKQRTSEQCSIRVESLLTGIFDYLLIIRRNEVEDILSREILENAN